MLQTLPIPPELNAAIVGLPRARRQAVLNARESWLDGGLSLRNVDRAAMGYAARLKGNALARVSQKARAVSRAAEQHERRMQLAFTSAVRRAQTVVVLSRLEAVLALGQEPMLEDVIAKLEAALG